MSGMQRTVTEVPDHFSNLLAHPQVECQALDNYLWKHIPLSQAMQAHATCLDAHGLTLSAPLAPNHNHQDSAFGGSLASLAVLAGWGLLWLALDHGRDKNIVVHDMHIEFLRPVRGELHASCPLPPPAVWEKFIATLRRGRKSRLELQIAILSESKTCVKCSGQYVTYLETVGDD
jgi:thioesterase domain-containing protein